LLEITQLSNRDFPIADDLILRGQAYLKLGEIASKAGQHDTAANHCFKGATEINDAFKAGRISRGDVRLIEVRSQLLERYVKMKDIAYPNPDDHLYVWESCLDAFWFQVRTPSIIEVGMDRLQTWWKAVERRSRFQFEAKKKLRHQIDRAKQVLSWYCDSVSKDTRGQMKRLQARLQPKTNPKSTGNRIMQKLQWISHQLLAMPNFKLVQQL